MAKAKQKPLRNRAEESLRERWEKLGIDALLPPEQRYIALYWLVGDVMNGGFHQYFSNSSGDLAPLALQGLKEVGASKTLNILEHAMAVFPPGAYSSNRERREEGLKAISTDIEVQIGAFDAVSNAFQAISDEDCHGMMLDRLATLYSSNGVWA